MAREIPLDQIGDYYRESLRILVAATTLEAEKRLKEKTPVRVVYEGEPKGGGRLRNAWQSDPAKGEVINNVEYAEPVITGNNLPPSWKGRWRSKGNQINRNYHLTVAKDIQNFIKANAKD